MKPLTTEAFILLSYEGHQILDTRNVEEIKKGFFKNSILLPDAEKAQEYAALFLNVNEPILLICDLNNQKAHTEVLQRAGFKSVSGFLNAGFATAFGESSYLDLVIAVEPDELMMDIPFDENLVVADIRPSIAFAEGHLKEAINLPIADLADPFRLSAIEEKDNLYLVGSSDAESLLAASVLKKQELHNLRIISGGWPALQQEQKAKIVKEPGMLN